MDEHGVEEMDDEQVSGSLRTPSLTSPSSTALESSYPSSSSSLDGQSFSLGGPACEILTHDGAFSAEPQIMAADRTLEPDLKGQARLARVASSPLMTRKNKNQLSLSIPSSTSGLSEPYRSSRSLSARLEDAKPRLSVGAMPEMASIRQAEAQYRSGPVEIDEGLYLGNEANAKDKRLLKRLKVDRVLCVAEEVATPMDETLSANEKDGVRRLKLAWSHNHMTILDELPQLVKFVDLDRSTQEPSHRAALVHCALGISRSVTVVIALIMQRRRWTFAKAYSYVKSKAPWASPNMTLIYQLCDLEGRMRADGVYEDE